MPRWSAADLAHVAAKGRVLIDVPVRQKYGNQPCLVDGLAFDSKLEAKRYEELKLLQRAGQIQGLEFHVHWPLHVGELTLGYYESDFSYYENGQQVIEDCKGVSTPLYRWKKKHVFAQYHIEIREIKA